MKKFIFYILFFLIAFFLIEAGSWTTIKVYKLINNLKSNAEIESEMVLLDGHSTEEFHKYQAFYGWTKKDITSKNINVKNGLRKTIENQNWDSKSKIWFFGGSTMWGAYVSDENTIPSLSSDLNHNFQPVNFGEEGYLAGQSLNRLIENIDKIKKGDHVVFLDGVNDVLHNCLSTNGPNGHSQVSHIRDLISNEKNIFKGISSKLLKRFTTTNTFALINGIGKKIGFNDLQKIDDFKYYSCDKKEYALEVAKSLVRHWKIAEVIVKNKNANFVCALQPNRYTANFYVNQPIREIWKQSTLAVYPKIKELASSLECFKDLTNLFQEDYYLDYCCHVNADGNKIIARKIINILFKG